MGIVHISEGDEIHVTRNGRTWRFRPEYNHTTMGMEILEAPRMCLACNVNLAYAEEEFELQLCPSCVQAANTYIGISHMMTGLAGDIDHVRETLRMFAEYDQKMWAEMRKTGIGYTDTAAAGIDEWNSRSPLEHGEALNEWWQAMYERLHPGDDTCMEFSIKAREE